MVRCGGVHGVLPSLVLVCLCRQRIASYKEIKRLQGLEHRTAEEEARLKSFSSSYEYDGNATCAADGMCQEKCPVKINTGKQQLGLIGHMS